MGLKMVLGRSCPNQFLINNKAVCRRAPAKLNPIQDTLMSSHGTYPGTDVNKNYFEDKFAGYGI